MINLLQEGKVLISEFINNVSPRLTNTNTFYRLGDDTIIELCKEKLKEIKPARMITLIEEVCTPTIQKWNSYGKYWVSKEKSTGEQTAKVLLESPSLRDNLKIIKHTLNVPVPLLIEGKLSFPKRGFNKKLCLYVNPNTPEITNPDLSIDEAKALIFDLLREFCFKTNNDSIKTLMALLTPFLRGLYKSWDTRTPLFIYFGNRERCGKDYLAGIRSIIFEGHAIEEPPISTGEKYNNTNDELRKKIMSLLRTGRHFLHFSNNKGHIDNATFEQVITATVWSDRLLGSNKIATFENTIEYSLSGNLGTTLTSDLKNRSIVINLFLRKENANERKFERPNLWGYIKQNRENILSALYSFVRNWYEKDMPISKVPFASFPEWAGICGGILEAADFENPLLTKDDSYAELDSELENMKLLFEFMYELFPNKDIKKSEIKTQIRINEEGENIFPYIDFDERADQMKFSNTLKKYIGRELSGITLIEDTKIKSVFARKIKFIKDYKPPQLDLKEIFSTTLKVKEVQK